MIGGFGGSGVPIELIHALIERRPRNLTVINNNAGKLASVSLEDLQAITGAKLHVTGPITDLVVPTL